MMSSIECPNCPGPAVPHHCKKEVKLTLAEQLKALATSVKKGRGNNLAVHQRARRSPAVLVAQVSKNAKEKLSETQHSPMQASDIGTIQANDNADSMMVNVTEAARTELAEDGTFCSPSDVSIWSHDPAVGIKNGFIELSVPRPTALARTKTAPAVCYAELTEVKDVCDADKSSDTASTPDSIAVHDSGEVDPCALAVSAEYVSSNTTGPTTLTVEGDADSVSTEESFTREEVPVDADVRAQVAVEHTTLVEENSETVPAVSSTTRPVDVEQVCLKTSAKGLFRYVSGVLNGTYTVDVVRLHVSDIVAWLGEDAVSDDSNSTGPFFWSVSSTRATCVSFSVACDALAAAIEDGAVPPAGISVLMDLRPKLSDHQVGRNSRLVSALAPSLCPRCCELPPASATCTGCKGSGTAKCTKCLGSGRFTVDCRMCSGSGVDRRRNASCYGCKGTGTRDQGECNRCKGAKIDAYSACDSCDLQPKVGLPRPLCDVCTLACRSARREVQKQAQGRRMPDSIPEQGEVTIEPCGASQLANLQSLWGERGSSGHVEAAWRVDNPFCASRFHSRREELKSELGRSPDELQGFHGTHPDNVISICKNGFDSGRRAGQVYGAGEYFAKCGDISVGYCRGGEYMIVCRLMLGHESSTPKNLDGDHIWVPNMSYYVIAKAEQVLPLYIIKFSSGHRYSKPPLNRELQDVLSMNSWTTKKAAAIVRVPPNRPCLMSRPTATVLWMGFLHGHFSDEDLEQDVRKFFQRHAPAHVDGLKVHIVKGHFKKAHAVLTVPMSQELVHKLNKMPFIEGGKERTICVDDGAGSPGQKCPKFIAGYCRGQNLRFTHPCWCSHPKRETEEASYYCDQLDLNSAKGNEIISKFMSSGGFHDGQPKVVGISAIVNKQLERCHEAYRRYLVTKHGEEPTVRELYHGTNNNILDVLYTHGLQPPSDVNASDACPVSGGKGLCTTLCPNTCKYCTEKHEWNRCHMFGLGIYLADLAQKSHRYCSQPEIVRGRRRYRMVICSVLGRAFKVEGHLRNATAMHDVANVRALQADDLAEMIEPCCQRTSSPGNSEEVAEKSDMLFVQGLGGSCRPGFSVFNSEYIAFHPHQCLPKYEITYEV